MEVVISRLFMPPRLKPIRYRRNQAFRLLDVGCGNHSPSITKRRYPNCSYVGIDRERYNNDDKDLEQIDAFYEVDISCGGLDFVPKESFDVVIASHVLEHLPNGIEVLGQLCTKLRTGGDVYIEYPGPTSLHLPHGRRCLNFHDDPTHVRVYSLDEISNVLLSHGLRILDSGKRRDAIRLALLPLGILRELYSVVRYGVLDGPALWDLLGFAEFVHGRKY
jgi:SAM-dependent methyltransferase